MSDKSLFQGVSELTTQNFIAYIKKRNSDINIETLKRAVLFSIQAHRNQFRKSGMPYAEHPIEVAKMLADYQMDTSTLIAGLLHDVVEDTTYKLEDIQNQFGAEVAFMVDAVTKISEIQSQSSQERKAETYRKFLISLAQEPRVLMIKICDRLHNMRTLNYIPKISKRKRISQETIEVYAPLAHRFGLHKIKSELEDLSFKYLNPDQYKDIVKQVVSSQEERERYIHKIVQTLKWKLKELGVDCKIQGRPKNIYSTYNKLKRRHCTLADIFDLFALRVLVPSESECYSTIGHIHKLWAPLQSRFKDYIALPKSNLYQSLHTSVVGPDEKIVEIQIRTQEMDKTAERGFAAHWAYKEGEPVRNSEIDWLEKMVHVQKEIQDSEEFLEFFRIDLKPTELMSFTPQGDLISLPHGANVLDFAYALHTNLGNQCIGARIDNHYVQPEESIPDGATVHILKSINQTPNISWLEVVKTHKAKSQIKKWIRQNNNEKSISLGKVLYQRELKLLAESQNPIPKMEHVLTKFNCKTEEDLYFKIGEGNLKVQEIYDDIGFPLIQNNGQSLVISDANNSLFTYAQCCNPVPGDELIGIFTQGQGISVHRSSCLLGLEMTKLSPQQYIPVQWEGDNPSQFETKIEVLAQDRMNLLDDITHIFSIFNINIQRATIVTTGNKVRNRFRIKVFNLEQLESALEKIRNLETVEEVERS
jgi:GTP pyrophosphokinase